MAKNPTSSSKTAKNGRTPVCPDAWKVFNLPDNISTDLYIQWNPGTHSFSIKVVGCGQRTPNVGWLKNGWLSLKSDQPNKLNFVYLKGEINAALGAGDNRIVLHISKGFFTVEPFHCQCPPWASERLESACPFP